MEKRPTRLFFSFGRLWTIARNTMTEVIRQKFFYILVIFGIVVIVLSLYFSTFSSLEQIKFVKDFSLAAISLFGALIAIVGTSQLLPLELENRTIYPILAKPVFRGEFLLGKYLGMMTLLFFTIVLMGAILGGLLYYTERQVIEQGGIQAPGLALDGISTQESIDQVRRQTRDPALIKAIVLIYVKVVIVGALTLLVSTFATSVIFTVISSFIIYICGHLESVARQAWQGDQAWTSKLMLLILTFFVPDLNAFNKMDEVILGKTVLWSYVINTCSYGLFYTGIVLLVAYFIFQEKEI